jgi:site-specific DNA-cytosine methylase
VFFCAIRNDIEAPKLQLAPKHKWVTAGEATEDLQELTAEEKNECRLSARLATVYEKIGNNPNGVIEKNNPKKQIFQGCKILQNQPARTVSASSGESFMHWDECRSLTYREWKRLGSFPDDYQAKTDKIGKYMIGMSVPPRMTEAVARAVIEQWLLPRQGSSPDK